MNKMIIRVISGAALLAFVNPVIAQTEQGATSKAEQAKAARAKDQAQKSSAITVEEIRIRNRLDRVILQHGENGPSEYYEMGNAKQIFSDGGLTERGVMRRWHFGDKKP